MKRTVDLDQIRVVQADNCKGNPRVYLEIMDARVLYTDLGNLPEHLISDGEIADTDTLTEMFRHMLGGILAQLLLDRYPNLTTDMSWSTKTDREIDYVKPRLEEDPYT